MSQAGKAAQLADLELWKVMALGQGQSLLHTGGGGVGGNQDTGTLYSGVFDGQPASPVLVENTKPMRYGN